MTLRLGHVIDGTSRLKNERFSCRRTAIRTDAQTDETRRSQRLFRTEKRTFDLAVEVFNPFYFYCLAYEITIT